MNSVTWKHEMSVGVHALDTDHKLLLSLINQLDNAIHHSEGEETTASVINALRDYTVYHFGREEQIMEACGYPDLETHKKIHVGLMKKVDEIRDKIEKEGSASVDKEVLNFMKTWLTDHIMGQDKSYAPFLVGKQDIIDESNRQFSEQASQSSS